MNQDSIIVVYKCRYRKTGDVQILVKTASMVSFSENELRFHCDGDVVLVESTPDYVLLRVGVFQNGKQIAGREFKQ